MKKTYQELELEDAQDSTSKYKTIRLENLTELNEHAYTNKINSSIVIGKANARLTLGNHVADVNDPRYSLTVSFNKSTSNPLPNKQLLIRVEKGKKYARLPNGTIITDDSVRNAPFKHANVTYLPIWGRSNTFVPKNVPTVEETVIVDSWVVPRSILESNHSFINLGDEVSPDWALRANTHAVWTSKDTQTYMRSNQLPRGVIQYNNIKYLNAEIAEQKGLLICRACGRFTKARLKCSCINNYNTDLIFPYHRVARPMLASYEEDEWKLGMEIEKEDLNVKGGQVARETYLLTGIAMERDGSLRNSDYNSGEGFEAVYPVLPLFDDKVLRPYFFDLEGDFAVSKKIMDAEYSNRCGGHMHMSSTKKSPTEVYHQHVANYLPLLYALYKNRTQNDYSKAQSKDDMLGANRSRRNAINITRFSCEIRLFPTPSSAGCQWWRVGLLRLMAKYPIKSYEDLIDRMSHPKSSLYRHLAKIFIKYKYKGQEYSHYAFHKMRKEQNIKDAEVQVINDGLARKVEETIGMIEKFEAVNFIKTYDLVKLENRLRKCKQ